MLLTYCSLIFAFLLTYFTCRQLKFDVLTSFEQLLILKKLSSTQLLFCIAAVVTSVRIITFLCFKIYKPIWRYAGVKEFRTFATAVGVSFLLLISLSVLLKRFDTWTFFLIDGIYSALLIGFIKFSHGIFT